MKTRTLSTCTIVACLAAILIASTWGFSQQLDADPPPEGPTIPPYVVFPDSKIVVEPMLGRPTDTSITVNIVPSVRLDLYVEYGHKLGRYTSSNGIALSAEGRQPVEVEITGLEPNSTYEYRVLARGILDRTYDRIAGGKFHTQRPAGSRFTFTIQADSHLISRFVEPIDEKADLYCTALENVWNDCPDFHFDLGDFAHIERYGGESAQSFDDAIERYLVQRKYLGGISASTPFFLALGNHEGEQGWRRTSDWDDLEVWGMTARKLLIPNPRPNGFYTGCEDVVDCCGLRESYYAWEWGDALFVVLDPYWYTMHKPHRIGGKYPSSGDGWDWTLGIDQYNWLYETLNNSDAKWKFVFAHQVTGGAPYDADSSGYYGRGGTPVAKYRLAGLATFEWGGEDVDGSYLFEQKRPGWLHGPIHDVMRDAGVNIFFHGHDHVFVKEVLDGVFYQACPQPTSLGYGPGYYSPDFYRGTRRNNSGHLRVSVSPDSVKVDYIRAVLPAHDPLFQDGLAIHNRDVSYSYILTD